MGECGGARKGVVVEVEGNKKIFQTLGKSGSMFPRLLSGWIKSFHLSHGNRFWTNSHRWISLFLYLFIIMFAFDNFAYQLGAGWGFPSPIKWTVNPTGIACFPPSMKKSMALFCKILSSRQVSCKNQNLYWSLAAAPTCLPMNRCYALLSILFLFLFSSYWSVLFWCDCIINVYRTYVGKWKLSSQMANLMYIGRIRRENWHCYIFIYSIET